MQLLLARGFLALAVAQVPDSLTLDQALARARLARPRVVAAAAVVDRATGAARLGALIPNPSAQFELDDVAPTYKLTATQPLAWLPRRGADLGLMRSSAANLFPTRQHVYGLTAANSR